VVKKFGEVKETMVKHSPIDSNPFLSIAIAFSVGVLLSQASSRTRESEESTLAPFFDRLMALLAPLVIEKIASELE
jgi:hypothetical protein